MAKKKINLDSLETLQPHTEKTEDKEIYLQTLNWALENDNIKNLAITGSYGSGKSSLLKTFWKNFHKKETVLEISAATFREDSILQEEQNLENVLEQHIMQQMFYKVKPEKIPLSRFTRIHNVNKFYKFLDTFLYILSILLIYLSLKYEGAIWMIHFLVSKENEIFSKLIYITISLIIIGIISLAVFRIVKNVKSFRLSNLGMGSANIEINHDNEETVFNRYLDEIIYFFTQTDYKIVVFEDFDRFNNLNIFERLRGLNHILNQSEELNDGRILFVYALKDDIFSGKDENQEVQNRTKFFDFIIPTVKILHSSNSESVLFNKLEEYIKDKKNGTDGLSKQLITDISLFINDMRILKNICNEYIIYRSALTNSGILQNKLFAIIVYKNLYPKDFSDLLNGKGQLISILNSKSKLIDILTHTYEYEIEKMERVYANIEENIIDSLDELVVIYLRKMNLLNSFSHITFNNRNYNIHNTNEINNFFQNLKENASKEPNIILKHQNQNNNKSLTFNEFCTAKGSKEDILIRAEAILVKEKNEELYLKQSLEKLKRDINELKTSSFSIILKKSETFLNENLNNAELLKVLLLQGWIEEDFDEYITYFYEGSMLKEDIDFLKSVRLNSPLDFDHRLKNKNQVQKKLSKEHFYSPAILNYDLLSFLSTSLKDEETQKRLYFIDFINKNFSTHFDFISGYISIKQETSTSELTAFLHELSKNNSDVWNNFQRNLKNRTQKINIFLLLFKANTPDEIEKLNSTKGISSFIIQSPDFLSWWEEIKLDNNKLDDLRATLEQLEVKFTELDSNNNSTDIKDLIIENNFYELNYNLFYTLLDEPDNINYQVIQNHSSKAIKDRIENEINSFVSEVLLKQNSYKESETHFLYLLNHEELDINLKLDLLKKWNDIIKSLSEVEDEALYTSILEMNKIKNNWSNIKTYHDTLNDQENISWLENFITSSNNFGDFIKSTKEIDIHNLTDEFYNNILEIIINSDKVKNTEFEKLMSILDREIFVDIPNNISKEKLEVLIDSQLLSFMEVNALLLCEKYPMLAIKYFEYNKEKLSNSDLKSLINNYVLPWGKTIFFYIQNYDDKLAFQYLLSFENDTLIEKLKEVNCNATLFLKILESDISLDTKYKMINSMRKLKVNFNFEINNWLIRTLKSEGFKTAKYSISEEIFVEDFLMSLKKQENIAFIFYNYIYKYNYTNQNLYYILKRLPDPFSLLVLSGKRNIEFELSDELIGFLEELKKRNMIASYSKETSKILVNNKMNIIL